MHRLTDADLVRSLRRLGPLLPHFTHRGETVDGSRRVEICKRYDIPIQRVEVKHVDVPHLHWLCNPEKIERASWRHPAHAAHAVYSDPGTVAAFWLAQAPQEGSRWQRLRKSFDALLQGAEEGALELTSDKLVAAVRKTL